MKIGDVLKRSWEIVWRYKVLWLFGLFAAEAGGSGFSGNFGNNTNTLSGSNPATQFGSTASEMLARYWPLLVGAGVFLLLVGIIWWIVGIAARGGIVVLSDDADSGREVRGSRGWSEGFRYWGRVFLQSLVFAVPIIVLTIVFVVVILALAGGSIAAIIGGSSGGRGGLIAGGIVGLLAGVCGLTAVFVIVVLAITVVYMVLVPVSLRYAVLHDRPAIKAIGDGWRLVRSKLGKVALTAVTLWGLSIAFGVAMLIVAVFLALPLIFLAIARIWVLVVLGGFVLVLVLMFFGAVWSAFYSVTWTVAFRRITAEEDAAPADASASTPPPYMPPPPLPETQAQEAKTAPMAVGADATAPAPPPPPPPPAPPAPAAPPAPPAPVPQQAAATEQIAPAGDAAPADEAPAEPES